MWGIRSAGWQGPRDPGAPRQVCYKAGVCICKGPSTFQPEHAEKLENEHAEVLRRAELPLKVDVWQGRPLPERDHGQGFSAQSGAQSSASSSAGCGGPAPGGEILNMWTHVAVQYLRPWIPVFSSLVLLKSEEERFLKLPLLEPVPDYKPPEQWFRLTLVEASGHVHFSTVFEMLRGLDTNLQWHVHVWELSQRARPCRMEVSVVHAKPCAVPPFQIWGGPGDMQKRKRQRKTEEWWSWAETVGPCAPSQATKRKAEEEEGLKTEDLERGGDSDLDVSAYEESTDVEIELHKASETAIAGAAQEACRL